MRKVFLLLALLAASALAVSACSNNGNDNAGTASTPAPAAESTPAPTATPAATATDDATQEVVPAGGPVFDAEDPIPFLDYHFPAQDLGGITIRFTGLGDPYNADNEADAARDTERRERVEQRFNVNMDFSAQDLGAQLGVDWSDIPDFILASIAAGNPVTNFFRGSAGYWFRALARQGGVVDMTDWFHANLPSHWYAFIGENNGRAYAINPGNYAWNFPVYNRELIRASGIEFTPSEMFEQGRWSWDDFHAYFAELRTLLPSDIEMIGMHISHWKRMGSMTNGAFIMHPSTHVPGILEDEYLAFANFTQRLVQDGLWRQPGFIEYGMLDGVPPEGQWSFVETWMENPMSHMELFRTGGLAFTVHHPWSIGDTSAVLELGIVPMPWGPRVSWPDSGDWRDLKIANPGLYNSPTHDTTNISLIAGTPDAITPEMFIAIMATWDPSSFAEPLIRDRAREAEGLPPLPTTPGGMHDLWTPEDMERYAWYASHPVWEPMDAMGFWGAPYGAIYSRGWQGTLATGGDFRPVFESVIGGIMMNLIDLNSMNESDVPAHLLPFLGEARAEAAAAAAAAEEEDEEDDD
jgi:maltose-binding protein MalE